VSCDYLNQGTANWLGLELQSTWDWLRNGHLVSIVGADVRRRSVRTSSDTLDLQAQNSLFSPPAGLNESDVIVSGYAEQIWVPTPLLRLSGGVRVDHDPRFSPLLTPRLAANWTAWSGATLKTSYSEAFRAPSWDETHNATSRRIAADDLRPETVRSVEATAEQRVGAHRVLVGGFYSWWNNLVELSTLSEDETIDAIRSGETTVPFTPGIQLTQYRNTTAVENYGLNMGVDGSLATTRFLYGFSLTGAIARRRTGDGTSRLPVAPQLFGNARVAYVFGEALPVVALAAHFLGPRPVDLAQGFSPTPYAPPQVELRSTLSGSVPVLPGLSYRATANYAFADRGPYVVGPVTSAIPTQSRPQLNPVDRFRTTVGLRYEF
jgi:outer membrane receptor protein involved in Fe transport